MVNELSPGKNTTAPTTARPLPRVLDGAEGMINLQGDQHPTGPEMGGENTVVQAGTASEPIEVDDPKFQEAMEKINDLKAFIELKYAHAKAVTLRKQHSEDVGVVERKRKRDDAKRCNDEARGKVRRLEQEIEQAKADLKETGQNYAHTCAGCIQDEREDSRLNAAETKAKDEMKKLKSRMEGKMGGIKEAMGEVE